MHDNRFEPSVLVVREDETVSFMFSNVGSVDHDAFVGDAEAQSDHEADMRARSGGAEEHGRGHSGSGKNGITVKPGTTAGFAHTFGKPGSFEVGCHVPGHYAAGMRIVITVT